MEASQITEMLAQQRQLLEAAKSRKGHKAVNKPSREQLLHNFNQVRDAFFSTKYRIRTCQINYSYPPSTTALANLKQINISELRLETHHVGRVLIVRTFGHPIRMQSVQNAIEDQNLDVDQLAVYNEDPKVSPAYVLPKDKIFAVKEPFYKTAASGGYIIRVDHPSDLLELEPSHQMVPNELVPRLIELDKDALELKNNGNIAFTKIEYLSALKAYTKALEACGEHNDSLKYDLYRNRSLVDIYLQRYEKAATDAIDAFIPEADNDEKKRENNVKAEYRAGRAYYCLSQCPEAANQFNRLLEAAPGVKDGRQQLERATARIKEVTSGNFDFAAMSSSVTPSHKRLDHASFTTNVDVRTSGKKGRGLFVTKEIKAGELILFEKAFSVAFESELGTDSYLILNLNTNTGNSGAHAVLFYDLVQKMRQNPNEAQHVLELFDGDYSPKCTAKVVDGVTSIDTFQVAAIMQHNCFGCPEMRSTDILDNQEASERETKGVGIWVTASYMNHACDANSHRSFLGDCMIVRATKDIDKDEEIFIPYRVPEFDYVQTQRELERVWNFKCTCNICFAEAKTSTANRKQRQALIKEMTALTETHRQSLKYTPSAATIKRAEKLYDKLDATYDKKLFTNVPRLPLAELSKWLCTAYQNEKTTDKVIDTAKRVLNNLGYGVEVDAVGHLLNVSRIHCCAGMPEIDAAMYAAHACFFDGKMVAGKQWEAFAKERYQTMYGELRNFQKRYG